MVPGPYLLYLGSSRDEVGIKTSRGLAVFRAEDCVGEFRRDDCPLTLGLARLGFADAVGAGANTLVLGIVNAGGRLAPQLVDDAEAALAAGLHVASGLHHRLKDEPRLVAAAQRHGRTLFDVREPPADLSVGNGAPRAGLRLLTVGTDCSVGKMYTTLALENELRARSIKADFRATGQTGILISGSGVPLDAVIADFISGAIEMISPPRHDGGWDLIEGQGSLFHPSFAGVSTGLLHGAQPDALVICHDPVRAHMRGVPHFRLPDIGACLEANIKVAQLTNPAVQAVGIALNTSMLPRGEAAALCAETSVQLGLPCTDPIAFGVTSIIDRLLQCFAPLAPGQTALS